MLTGLFNFFTKNQPPRTASTETRIAINTSEIKAEMKEPLLSSEPKEEVFIDIHPQQDTSRAESKRKPAESKKNKKKSKRMTLEKLVDHPPEGRGVRCPLSHKMIVIPVKHKAIKSGTFEYYALRATVEAKASTSIRARVEGEDSLEEGLVLRKQLSEAQRRSIEDKCVQEHVEYFRANSLDSLKSQGVTEVQYNKEKERHLRVAKKVSLDDALKNMEKILVTVSNLHTDWEIDWEYLKKRDKLLAQHGYSLKKFLKYRGLTLQRYESMLQRLKLEFANWDKASELTDPFFGQLLLVPICHEEEKNINLAKLLFNAEAKDEKEDKTPSVKEKTIFEAEHLARSINMRLEGPWKINWSSIKERDRFLKEKGLTPEDFLQYRKANLNGRTYEGLLKEWDQWFNDPMYQRRFHDSFFTPDQRYNWEWKLIFFVGIMFLLREALSGVAGFSGKPYTWSAALTPPAYYPSDLEKLKKTLTYLPNVKIENQIFAIRISKLCQDPKQVLDSLWGTQQADWHFPLPYKLRQMNYNSVFGIKENNPLLMPHFYSDVYVWNDFVSKFFVRGVTTFLLAMGMNRLTRSQASTWKRVLFHGASLAIVYGCENLMDTLSRIIVFNEPYITAIKMGCNNYEARSLTTNISVSYSEQPSFDLMGDTFASAFWVLFIMSAFRSLDRYIEYRSTRPPLRPLPSTNYAFQYEDFDFEFEPANKPPENIVEVNPDVELEQDPEESGNRRGFCLVM